MYTLLLSPILCHLGISSSYFLLPLLPIWEWCSSVKSPFSTRDPMPNPTQAKPLSPHPPCLYATSHPEGPNPRLFLPRGTVSTQNGVCLHNLQNANSGQCSCPFVPKQNDFESIENNKCLLVCCVWLVGLRIKIQ